MHGRSTDSVCKSMYFSQALRIIGNPSGALTHSDDGGERHECSRSPCSRVVSRNADARPVASTEAGWSLDASQVLALERVALEQTTP